jgi:dihydroorotase
LHIPTVSTAKSVQLIAKAKGLQVSCSAAVHHLVLTDENWVLIHDLKFLSIAPKDRKALLKEY